MIMNKLTPTLLFALLSSLSFALLAEEVQPKHLEQINALQRRADTLAFGELGSNNYHLAKARAWLNMATSEYHQVDTSGAMFGAMTQAETILTALENKQPDISVDMPADFPGAEKVRPDLWDKIAAIKSKANYACGQRPLAEAEVQLIWAGHEKVESGWSHAESYARITEDLISEAQVAINICNAPVVAAPVVMPPAVIPAPVIATPVAAVEKITLSGDALFALGKSTLNASATPSLDELAVKIKKVTSFDEIMLVGHTDRLRSDGHPERNQTLSEDRAETVKQYLIGKGIAGNKMHASGAGPTQPIVQCDDKQMNKNKTKLAACLQPNRRVEIIFHGVK
jgi:OmpA-OmpF porin, OOP family